jgi:hypothetical protein
MTCEGNHNKHDIVLCTHLNAQLLRQRLTSSLLRASAAVGHLLPSSGCNITLRERMSPEMSPTYKDVWYLPAPRAHHQFTHEK